MGRKVEEVELEGHLKRLTTGTKLDQTGLPQVTLQLVIDVTFTEKAFAGLGQIAKDNLKILLQPTQMKLLLDEPPAKGGRRNKALLNGPDDVELT